MFLRICMYFNTYCIPRAKEIEEEARERQRVDEIRKKKQEKEQADLAAKLEAQQLFSEIKGIWPRD